MDERLRAGDDRAGSDVNTKIKTGQWTRIWKRGTLSCVKLKLLDESCAAHLDYAKKIHEMGKDVSVLTARNECDHTALKAMAAVQDTKKSPGCRVRKGSVQICRSIARVYQ